VNKDAGITVVPADVADIKARWPKADLETPVSLQASR
jgi:hypothetical protein